MRGELRGRSGTHAFQARRAAQDSHPKAYLLYVERCEDVQIDRLKGGVPLPRNSPHTDKALHDGGIGDDLHPRLCHIIENLIKHQSADFRLERDAELEHDAAAHKACKSQDI